ncbi:MAG: CAP domain-containing protein [Chloroflexota bacterium]
MTKQKRWLVLASLVFLTTSASLSAGFGLTPSHEVSAQPNQSAPLYSASELIAEVNALRASNGLPAYQTDPILMQIAQAHSDHMASTGTVTHYGADGSRPYQRALDAGFPLAGDLSQGGFFSENITGGNKTPAQAVAEWQGDAPHLNTMLSPNLTHVGAGVTVSGGRTYYTLDAAAALGSTVNYTPPAGGSTSLPGTPPAAMEVVRSVVTSTPKDDGSLYHEVLPGEALWSIALAYNTTVDQLKQLNRLGSNEIYEGQVLLIRSDTSETVTATSDAPTMTVTIGVPLSTATRPATATGTATATPVPTPPATLQGGGLVVGIILIGALTAAGIGTWLGTKKSD